MSLLRNLISVIAGLVSLVITDILFNIFRIMVLSNWHNSIFADNDTGSSLMCYIITIIIDFNVSYKIMELIGVRNKSGHSFPCLFVGIIITILFILIYTLTLFNSGFYLFDLITFIISLFMGFVFIMGFNEPLY